MEEQAQGTAGGRYNARACQGRGKVEGGAEGGGGTGSKLSHRTETYGAREGSSMGAGVGKVGRGGNWQAQWQNGKQEGIGRMGNKNPARACVCVGRGHRR